MKVMLASLLVGSALLLADPAEKASPGSLDAAVESYEHLAVAPSARRTALICTLGWAMPLKFRPWRFAGPATKRPSNER